MCGNVYHAALEKRIELLDVLHIMLLKLNDAVILDVKVLCVMMWFYDVTHIVIYWVVEETIADEIDKMVWINAGMILLEKVWMLSDERNDIVHFLLWRLKATFPICRHDELVTFYPCSIAVQTHIRGIAQAITSIKVIVCVLQHVLYVNTCFEIIV